MSLMAMQFAVDRSAKTYKLLKLLHWNTLFSILFSRNVHAGKLSRYLLFKLVKPPIRVKKLHKAFQILILEVISFSSNMQVVLVCQLTGLKHRCFLTS